MRHYRKSHPDRFLLKRQGLTVDASLPPSGTGFAFPARPEIAEDRRSRRGRAKRDVLVAAHNDYRAAALIVDEGDAAGALLRLIAATRQAEALGFSYRTSSEIASGPLAELVRRVLAILSERTPPVEDAAVLGREDRPKAGCWDAYELYRTEIKKEHLARKSPGQLRRWESTRKGSISSFISLVGGKPIEETTREDARTLYNYWLDRVVPDDKSKRRYCPNSANKQIGGAAGPIFGLLRAPGRGGQEEPVFALEVRGKRREEERAILGRVDPRQDPRPRRPGWHERPRASDPPCTGGNRLPPGRAVQHRAGRHLSRRGSPVHTRQGQDQPGRYQGHKNGAVGPVDPDRRRRPGRVQAASERRFSIQGQFLLGGGQQISEGMASYPA